MKLGKLYIEWNNKINIISRKDIHNLYERHILHCLSIAKFISFLPNTRIIDLGTGGGFPGIPLAIFFPESQFFLVDSILKKIYVVENICASIKIKNIILSYQRIENTEGKFDFIVSRATAPIQKLYLWSNELIHHEHKHRLRNGIICLKGGDLNKEFQHFKHPYQQKDLSIYYEELFFKTKKLIYVPIAATIFR